MRTNPWPGLRQDTSDLGADNLTVATNIQFRIQGELRDRPGLGTRYNIIAQRLAFLESAGGRHLISKNGTHLYTQNSDVPSGASNDVKSGLNSAVGCFTSCMGAVYYSNGTDAMQVIYDGSGIAYAAGIAAPASAPTVGTEAAGAIAAGVHLIRYRYKNSATGYMSNPSAALSYTAAGSKNAPLTIAASADAKVTNIVVEMTQAAGNAFYVVATTTNTTSYTISMDDTTLGVQQLSDVYAAPDGFGHDVPPTSMTVIAEHKNRIFGIANNYLYWSRPSFPEGWNVLDWAKQIFTSGGNKPVALGSYFGDLYVFGQQGMARLVFEQDPASGMLVQMPANLGVWNQQCVVSVEGELFGFGRQGIFRISAIQPELISQPVKDTVVNDVDGTYATSTAFAFFDPNERVVWFMYRSVSDTSVQTGIAFDLQSGTWSLRSFRHTINAAVTTGSTASSSYAFLADGNAGYTWRLEDNQWDCASGLASGVVTALAGSTTSVLNVSQALPTSPNLTGAILFNPATGEERVISTNTANTITCSAFSTTPAVGAEYYIGSIDQTVRSGHIPVHYLNPGRRPEIFNIEHLSVAASAGVTVDIRYYLDYGSTPIVWTVNTTDPQLGGASIATDGSHATQLLDSGRGMVPVPGEYMLTIQWELKRNRPAGRMRLLDCHFDWNDQKAEDVPH